MTRTYLTWSDSLYPHIDRTITLYTPVCVVVDVDQNCIHTESEGRPAGRTEVTQSLGEKMVAGSPTDSPALFIYPAVPLRLHDLTTSHDFTTARPSCPLIFRLRRTLSSRGGERSTPFGDRSSFPRAASHTRFTMALRSQPVSLTMDTCLLRLSRMSSRDIGL